MKSFLPIPPQLTSLVNPPARPQRRWFRLGLLLSSLLWVACDTVEPDPPETEYHLVILGSSTAEGAGVSDYNQSWAGKLTNRAKENSPTWKVTNLAKGGYTSRHLLPQSNSSQLEPAPDLRRNIDAALQLNPDGIIINLPSNDIVYGYSVAENLENYRTISARAGSVPIWYSTAQPRDVDPGAVAKLQALSDSVQVQYGTRALDFWTGIASDSGKILPQYDSGDGVHLNADGHEILFQRVLDQTVLETIQNLVETQGQSLGV